MLSQKVSMCSRNVVFFSGKKEADLKKEKSQSELMWQFLAPVSPNIYVAILVMEMLLFITYGPLD